MNFLTDPENLAGWTGTRASIGGDVFLAPDGTMTGERLNDDNSGGNNFVAVIKNTLPTVVSEVYTYSHFLRVDQLDWARLQIFNNGSDVTRIHVDITNRVLGAAFGGDEVAFGLEEIDDDWIRAWLAYTAQDTAQTARLFVAEGDNDVAVDLDGTSSIGAWGAMVNLGDTPDPYISEAGIKVPSSGDGGMLLRRRRR